MLPIYEAIADRVLFGKDHGGFVEHVANRDWERALWNASPDNLEIFTWIMKNRLWHLPLQPAPYNGPPVLQAERYLDSFRAAFMPQPVKTKK